MNIEEIKKYLDDRHIIGHCRHAIGEAIQYAERAMIMEMREFISGLINSGEADRHLTILFKILDKLEQAS